MRLQNIYKSFSVFEGYPAPVSDSPPLVQFYSGEDVVMEGYLAFEDKPVVTEDWEIIAIVKTGVYSSSILWEGKSNDGVYTEASKPGYYKVLIPNTVFCGQAPGTYWMDLVLKEQIGRFNGLRDRTVIAARIPFSFDISASSPEIVSPKRVEDSLAPPSVNITKL